MSEVVVGVKGAAPNADPAWTGVYRVGGICLLLAGILYMVGAVLGYSVGTPPGNNEAFLDALASHRLMAQAAHSVFALTDVLFIPAVLGLYLALKGIDRNAMLVAAALLAFFILLDLGITETNTLALIALTQNYALVTRESQALMYEAAAHWGLATLPVATFFSWVGPSSGWLITSIVMRKSVFGTFPAVLGMIVNGLGILAGFYFLYPIPLLGLFLTPILILYGVWLIAAGRRLLRLGAALADPR